MLKLAIVRQKYRPDGGAERFVASALTALTQQTQLQVSVLTRQWQGNNNSDFEIIPCNPFKWGRVSREAGFAHSAKKHFSKFDIVQSHERIPGCSIFRAGDGVHKVWLEQRSRILSDKQACRLKRDRFHRYVLQAEKDMFEHPELRAVICNSEMVKAEIANHFEINPEIIHVIYNSVDHQTYNSDLKHRFRHLIRQKLSIHVDSTVLLFVGSGFERKGLDASIKALAKTQSHLIVVGKDKELSKYQQLCIQLGCEQRVHFVGMQKEPEKFYGAADGFILPTLYDPFPNVILEAMASGLGTITSHSCGGAEIIQNDQNGYICDALDITALTNAIERFEQPGVAQRVGVEAQKTVADFTPERLSHELVTLYNEVLKI